MPPRKIKSEETAVRSTILQPEEAAELNELVKLKKKESTKRKDGKKAPKTANDRDKTSEDAQNSFQVGVSKPSSVDNTQKRPPAEPIEVSGPSNKCATQQLKAITFASNDLPTI